MAGKAGFCGQATGGAALFCFLEPDNTLTCDMATHRFPYGGFMPEVSYSYIGVAMQYYVCGIKTDGHAACNNDLTRTHTSGGTWVRALPTTETFDQISTGFAHGCGRRISDRKVSCWGRENYWSNQNVVNNGFDMEVDMVYTGDLSTCVIKTSDKSVACVGDPRMWESNTFLPTEQYIYITGGGYVGCGIKIDRTLKCWGKTDDRYGVQSGAAQITGVVLDIACSASYCIGVKEDNTLFVLVSQAYDYDHIAQDVPTTAEWKAVIAGYKSACGIKLDNSAFCWGNSRNFHGLGIRPTYYNGRLEGKTLKSCDVTNCVTNLVSTKATCTVACGTVPPVVQTAANGGGAACTDYDCATGDGQCGAVINCVTDLTATRATCPATCGTVTAVPSTAAANGGTTCADYSCNGGDGSCPVVYADLTQATVSLAQQYWGLAGPNLIDGGFSTGEGACAGTNSPNGQPGWMKVTLPSAITVSGVHLTACSPGTHVYGCFAPQKCQIKVDGVLCVDNIELAGSAQGYFACNTPLTGSVVELSHMVHGQVLQMAEMQIADASAVNCVPNAVATKATCPAGCGTVSSIAATEASNGGAQCTDYTCTAGDGSCPTVKQSYDNCKGTRTAINVDAGKIASTTSTRSGDQITLAVDFPGYMSMTMAKFDDATNTQMTLNDWTITHSSDGCLQLNRATKVYQFSDLMSKATFKTVGNDYVFAVDFDFTYKQSSLATGQQTTVNVGEVVNYAFEAPLTYIVSITVDLSNVPFSQAHHFDMEITGFHLDEPSTGANAGKGVVVINFETFVSSALYLFATGFSAFTSTFFDTGVLTLDTSSGTAPYYQRTVTHATKGAGMKQVWTLTVPQKDFGCTDGEHNKDLSFTLTNAGGETQVIAFKVAMHDSFRDECAINLGALVMTPAVQLKPRNDAAWTNMDTTSNLDMIIGDQLQIKITFTTEISAMTPATTEIETMTTAFMGTNICATVAACKPMLNMTCSSCNANTWVSNSNVAQFKVNFLANTFVIAAGNDETVQFTLGFKFTYGTSTGGRRTVRRVLTIDPSDTASSSSLDMEFSLSNPIEAETVTIDSSETSNYEYDQITKFIAAVSFGAFSVYAANKCSKSEYKTIKSSLEL